MLPPKWPRAPARQIRENVKAAMLEVTMELVDDLIDEVHRNDKYSGESRDVRDTRPPFLAG
jgi:hypothetical protein